MAGLDEKSGSASIVVNQEEIDRVMQDAALDHPFSPSKTQQACMAFVHSWRTLGYLPWLGVALTCYPRQFAVGAAAYFSLRFRTNWWNNAVHRLVRYGSSRRPRIIAAQKTPYDRAKQYVVSVHPHGLLICAVFNVMSRYQYIDRLGSCFGAGFLLMDGLQIFLAVAPIVNYLPMHGELYQNRGIGSSAKECCEKC